MRKTTRLTETDLNRLVKRTINEQRTNDQRKRRSLIDSIKNAISTLENDTNANYQTIISKIEYICDYVRNMP